jgi:uncharacterized SAM-binding protein YcdF (DUF218 family)
MLPPVLSPLTLAVVALLLAAWPVRAHRPLARWPGLGLTALAWLAMTPLGANVQVWAWERAVPAASPFCGRGAVTQIIALTGGFDRVPRDARDAAALTPDTLRRMFFLRDFALAHSQARVLVVGGGAQAIPESRVAARLLADLGVPAARLQTEERSASTWDNARAVATWQPPLAEPLYLVSGGLHLPRATRAFQAMGLPVCPVAADSRFVRPAGLGALWPQSSALEKTEAVWHEMLGTLRDTWRS